MLKVPQLDDLSYEQIIQRAIGRIPAMTNQWTDFNMHDPGITVLQTYAWLVDMLQYYMNATGDIHVEKYLKLLGIEAKKASKAEGYVVVSGSADAIKIEKGSRLFAGKIPFETAEDCIVEENSFCSFINEVDDYGIDLTAFAGVDGEYAEAFAKDFQKQAVLYFGFEKPLHQNDRIYIQVKKNKKRNPFEHSFYLSELRWELYSKDGWMEIEVEDETCGFLQTGFLTLKTCEEMQNFKHPEGRKGGYFLRCILKEDSYDFLPQIGMLYVNPIRVVQQKTICKKGELRPELKIGTTDGCAGQELLFDYPYAYSFSLMLCSEGEEDELWTYTDALEQADYREKVFTYDAQQQMIRFGDGLHGAVPKQKKAVYVTDFVCSFCDEGNIMAGELKEFQNPAYQCYQVKNPQEISGGRKKETVFEMLERTERVLFSQQRLASKADYEKIIRKTPGLMIELVQVIPGRTYGEMYHQVRSANEVVVVVKAESLEKCPELSPIYKRKIEQYIESFRMLNTKVSVVSPSYVGIEVYGKIELRKDSKEAREEVLQCLKEKIEYMYQKKPFGAIIPYGKLFMKLEALDEVTKVVGLSLERVGRSAVKNERGDIFLNEDALAYLSRVEIQFC